MWAACNAKQRVLVSDHVVGFNVPVHFQVLDGRQPAPRLPVAAF
jgi:hypothetical protein